MHARGYIIAAVLSPGHTIWSFLRVSITKVMYRNHIFKQMLGVLFFHQMGDAYFLEGFCRRHKTDGYHTGGAAGLYRPVNR